MPAPQCILLGESIAECDALSVVDGTVEAVSEGHWKLFTLRARWYAAGRRKRPWPDDSGDRQAVWSSCGTPGIVGSSTYDRS